MSKRFVEQFDLVASSSDGVAKLRETILQLAVRGRLLPQSQLDEPASKLLQKIELERAKQKTAWAGQRKRSDNHSEGNQSRLLPKGWEWVRLWQVADARLGKMLDKAKNSGAAYPYLRNKNVQWLRFELDDIKEIHLEDREREEYRLRLGDLLVCEGGEPGRCAIWRDEQREMYFQKALHRVRTLGGVLPEYLAMCLKLDAQTGQLEKYFTGATIKHFAGQELSRYAFALPPAAEQQRIVLKVAELLAFCDKLDSDQAHASRVQDRLARTLIEDAIR